jgi:hypothetical protein
MLTPTYAAARTAADRIHGHFARRAISAGSPVGTLPDAATLTALIDTTFWTSLRREEIYTPRLSLAFVSQEQAQQSMAFATPLPLVPNEMTKLAASVERPGIHLCVWPKDEELQAWGIARHLPAFCLVLEVIVPGLLVVKQSPPTKSGKFLNIAVLQGDEIKIIDPQATAGREGPPLLASLLRREAEALTGPAANVLLQLAVSMRAHGRGGLLLVVPPGSDAWKDSMLHPMSYAVTPPYSGLADLLDKDGSERASRGWEDAIARGVDGIAGLTAVDGATVITARYELLAFGAKIVRRRGSGLVTDVTLTEPVEGSSPTTTDPAQLGGTRHLAAAQFVHDQPDAIALVASQDGRFTVFGWAPLEGTVHAHRIEVLLL